MTTPASSNWVDDVLRYWFDELSPSDWFSASPQLDAAIRERFAPLLSRLAAGVPDQVWIDARAALAAVIVLDQMSRNVFRKTAAAFANDGRAVDIARNAVDRGLDQQLDAGKRGTLYMPFMHSEMLADQDRSIELFTALGNEGSLPWAHQHRDVIARFGRFPHRNDVLGRASTPEELEYLASAERYGQ